MAFRILIVEDSAVIRARITTLIASIPSASVVGHAETSEDAINAISDLRPDLITLDIGLRSGNGFDVLRWLSTHDDRRLDVIVVTLIERSSIHDRLAEWNVSAILDKSTDFNELADVVSRLSARHLSKKNER